MHKHTSFSITQGFQTNRGRHGRYSVRTPLDSDSGWDRERHRKRAYTVLLNTAGELVIHIILHLNITLLISATRLCRKQSDIHKNGNWGTCLYNHNLLLSICLSIWSVIRSRQSLWTLYFPRLKQQEIPVLLLLPMLLLLLIDPTIDISNTLLYYEILVYKDLPSFIPTIRCLLGIIYGFLLGFFSLLSL